MSPVTVPGEYLKTHRVFIGHEQQRPTLTHISVWPDKTKEKKIHEGWWAAEETSIYSPPPQHTGTRPDTFESTC